IDLLIDDQSAADAGANRHVKDRREALACPKERFAEPGDIGVVADRARPAELLFRPVGERESIPAADLMRFQDAASGIVDRSAETDADAENLPALKAGLAEDGGDGVGDLSKDALGAGRDIDPAAPQLSDRAVARPNSDLNLGAAG